MHRSNAAFEGLESRSLFSSTLDTVVATPANTVKAAAATSTTAGITPSLIKAAYGIDDISFGSTAGTGKGQTIAIVDAYNDPNLASDLATFSSAYSLDAANLSVVSQTGSKTSLPKTDADWAGEISLDVEWAHAVAPDANILLVEANSSSMTDLLAAVKYASSVSSVSVVSMSWGTSEFSNELSYNSYFTTPSGHQGITYVASSGDSSSVEWPAISTNVLSVGGTTLNVSTGGTVSSETGWSDAGGGSSRYLAEANYATGVQSTGHATSPDVAYDANPSTGFAVYDTVADDGVSGWQTVGGTSAGAPQWAALVAIADQGRSLQGLTSLDGATGTLPTLYSLASNSSTYAADFTDITGGGSRFASAGAGYDYVTGLGSPKAASLVAALSTSTTTSSGWVTSTGALATSQQTPTRRPPQHWGRGGGPFGRNIDVTQATNSPAPTARAIADVAHVTATQVLNNAVAIASSNRVAGGLGGSFASVGSGSSEGSNASAVSTTRFAAAFSSTPIDAADGGMMLSDSADTRAALASTSGRSHATPGALNRLLDRIELASAAQTTARALKAREEDNTGSTEVVTAVAASIGLGLYLAHVQRRKQSARDSEA